MNDSVSKLDTPATQMVDPAKPDEIIKVNIKQRQPVQAVYFGLDNYKRGINTFDFWTYLKNSVVVTAVATILTLLVNSMAAFGLSKYQFRGRNAIFFVILSTLMVPLVR